MFLLEQPELVLMGKTSRGTLCIVLSAFGFGIGLIFALYAYQRGVSVFTLLFLRFSLSSILLFGYLFLQCGKKLPEVTGWTLLLVLGILHTLQSICYYSSVKYIPASLTALILYSYPAFVCLLSFLIDRVSIGKRLVLSLGTSFVGLALILDTSFKTANVIGLMFAFGAAIVYSCYIVISNRVLRKVSPLVSGAYIILFTAGFISFTGILSRNISFQFSPSAWIPILGFVIFSTILANVLFLNGIKLLGSTKASILSVTEPLFTIISATLLFHDPWAYHQVFGGILVLLGVLLSSLPR
jgi:drug/metabolite transporter (DMT)-like permease